MVCCTRIQSGIPELITYTLKPGKSDLGAFSPAFGLTAEGATADVYPFWSIICAPALWGKCVEGSAGTGLMKAPFVAAIRGVGGCWGGTSCCNRVRRTSLRQCRQVDERERDMICTKRCSLTDKCSGCTLAFVRGTYNFNLIVLYHVVLWGS